MSSERTRCLKCYLAPGRSRVDREVLSKMLADRSRGISYSATIRAALVAYYRPAPPASDNGQSAASAVLLLAAQVRDLTAEVERLRAEVAAMRRELACALEVVQ